MSSPYVCPNGHDVELVIMIPCDEGDCHALVAYEPVAHGMQLHTQLEQYEHHVAERDRWLRRLIVVLVVLNVAQAVLVSVLAAT